MEEQRHDRGVDEAAPLGGLWALEAAASAPPPSAGGEHGGALLGGEAAGLAAAGGSVGRRGAAEALEGPPGQGSVRCVLAGIAGGAPDGGDGQRGGRRGPAGPMEMSQIRGEARIIERPAVEPEGDPVQGRGVDAARVRRGGPRDELGRGLRVGAVRGGKGAAGAASGHILHDRQIYHAGYARA